MVAGIATRRAHTVTAVERSGLQNKVSWYSLEAMRIRETVNFRRRLCAGQGKSAAKRGSAIRPQRETTRSGLNFVGLGKATQSIAMIFRNRRDRPRVR